MKILDLTAGNRAIWYNKNNPLCLYIDKRKSVKPDIVCDARKIPRKVGRAFDLIVFDPPHMNCGKNSNMSRVYGHHRQQEIFDLIIKASDQAHNISKKNALMAFKWNDHDTKLEKILKLMPKWEPLFGHITKDGPGSKTYWVLLRALEKIKS